MSWCSLNYGMELVSRAQESLMRKLQIIILSASLGICLYLIYAAQGIEATENTSSTSISSFLGQSAENAISTELGTIQQGSRFQLIPLGRGQFELIYDNHQGNEVSIQVYDVIGNLLLEEDSNHHNIQKSYDLSESGSRLFVVKVNNQRQSRVKKVTAG